MPITVDSRDARQHAKILVGLKVNLGVDNVLTETLEFGDYAFHGHPLPDGERPSIGIELATVSDAVGKLNSGRLAYQMSGLVTNYNVRVLMIQGDIAPDDKGNVRIPGAHTYTSYQRFQMVLHSIKAHGVVVEHTRNQDDSMQRILGIYRWWQKDPSKHDFMRKTEAEVQVGLELPLGPELARGVSAMMSLVRNLGEDKALAALKHYGRLDVLTQLTEEDLQMIPGWGPVLAKRWREEISRNYK